MQTPRPQKRLIRMILMATAVAATTVLLPSARGQQADEADFKTEAKFHKIYKKFNETPTSNEAWEKALSNRKANTYPIQKDDTLWDISHTFFGDSNYWPKIWSYNTDNILNPHEISPKNMIKFYPGTMAEAPTVGLADAAAAPEAMPDKIIEKTPGGSIEGIQIPPPKRKSRPLVRNLPSSLPLYRLGAVNRPPAEFESETLIKKLPPPIRDLSHYVLDKPPESVGEVVEAEMASGVMSADFQYIVVRLTDPSQKHLVAYNDETRVSDPFAFLSSSGTIVEIQGEIEVLDKVSDSENLYRAVVKKIIDPLEVGSKLTVGKIESFNAGKTAVVSALQARIIGGENHRYIQNLFGDDTIVFLNAGAKDGLQVGTTLPIFLNEKLRNAKTHAITNDRVIGAIKVIKLAEHFATAYIVSTGTELIVGDYVGGREAPADSKTASSASKELKREEPAMDDSKSSAPSEPNSDKSSGESSGTNDELQL